MEKTKKSIDPRKMTRTSTRRKVIPSLTALLLISTSGCVINPDSPQSEINSPGTPNQTPQEPPTDNEIIATSTTTATSLGENLEIHINSLERTENDLLRLRISITNNSDEPFDLGTGLAQGTERRTAGNISLIDEVNQQRYMSYKQSDGGCFCDSLESPISSGSTESLWVIFPAPPERVESLTVTTPLTPPFLDLPISPATESIENKNLEEPEVLDLTAISDSLGEDQTGRTENSEEVSIILSSDVLFDTNKSDLNAEAQEILEQVAREIDDADSSVVSIDGHADNTGNESINLPLSRERASSVESALREMITREGIDFNVEGHGSADPIADNQTEEGRERNRRVSVTFEK
ncbi:OmpA family protein [Nocardiopsis alba]|uniref:OmpA family protein n=1 Tax=Nocardiopsis alba TaxID=53437 RepID=UPI0033B9B3BD